MNNTIRLTDTDGIIFDLDIDATSKVVSINSIKEEKTIIHIIDGSEIVVMETACDVMQKIADAKFGTQKSS